MNTIQQSNILRLWRVCTLGGHLGGGGVHKGRHHAPSIDFMKFCSQHKTWSRTEHVSSDSDSKLVLSGYLPHGKVLDGGSLPSYRHAPGPIVPCDSKKCVARWPNYRGRRGIPCGGKYESTISGATKCVPSLKNERTKYVRIQEIAHEKQWALVVLSWSRSELQHFWNFHGG